MIYLTVVPAYGRDYRNQKEAKADWESGKDFTVADMSSKWDGAKINLEDAKNYGVGTINIRYAGLRKIAVVKVK